MKFKIYSRLCLLAFLLIGLSSLTFGQTTINGTVTDAAGQALIGANVLIKGTSVGTVTDIDGSFSLSSSRGLPMTLVVSYTGYTSEEITVTDRTPLTITLTEGILAEQVVVSASRKREKVQEAPASVSVLGARQLTNSAQAEPIRNLVNVPGVQIQQQSAARINIEMRASSGIFGTSVFPIMDYRSLVAPGIGVFQSDAAGISNIDLDRIEIVRGPGSALYGPGVTSGVVHFITKSPIDHPGGTVQVGYGELNTLITAGRYAWANDDKKFGFKINAQYNQGDEFTLDGSEGTFASTGAFETQFSKFKTQIVQPVVVDGRIDMTQAANAEVIETLSANKDGNVMQDNWWNVAFNTTLEFRPQDDLSFILSGGYNEASAVFYNDLGEGLSQAAEIWTQARVQKGGLFAQLFYVDNDGGEKDKSTYLYQTGNRSGVARKQLEGQIQYNVETPDFLGADWTVGADFRQAISDSRHLTYGKNDDDDDYVIYGGYLQGKFALVDQLDLVVAGRYDRFNFLDDGFFSPRVALVIKPDPKHTFRLSFNRAANPATALETYVDFPVNAPAPGVLDFWLAGQTNVQDFGDNPMIDMVFPGVPDLPFGTPGLPLAIAYGAVNQQVLDGLIPLLEGDPLTAPLAPAIEQFLLGYSPSPTALTGTLTGVNFFEVDDNGLPRALNEVINTNESTLNINNTYEVGYKGLFEDKLSASIDVYYTERSGFSDFTQIGPAMVLDGTDIPADLAADVTTGVTPFLIETLTPLIGQAAAEATAAQLAPQIGGVLCPRWSRVC